MALINSTIDDMNGLLNRTYRIPNYQREYSWGNDELQDFWNDLMDTLSDHNRVHFFGQVVVHNDQTTGYKYIIDGQQRTTTSMLFLRALQEFCKKVFESSGIRSADYNRTDIESKYLGREGQYHLTLGQSDNEYFVRHILQSVDVATRCTRASNENIRKAYIFFQDNIDKKLQEKDDEEKEKYLTNLLKTFTERFKVLYMEATELEEAFVIFETLNARGKDLETADLLKNYLFSKSNDITTSVNSWNTMMNKLDRADATKYIRYYWNASNTFSRDKNLYRNIAQVITTPRKSTEFLSVLEALSPVYHDLVIPSEPIFFTDRNDTIILDRIKALSTLKATTYCPIILAIVSAFPSDNCKSVISEVLNAIEIYVFRNATICGNSMNSAETFFAGIAKDIFDQTLTSAQAICEKIKNAYETDTMFVDSFRVYKGKKTTKETIRYIFRKIHKHLDPNLEINLDNSEVHIEHIMPENNNQWNVPAEIHEAYLWRLGNLALLSGPINIDISNRPFDEKNDGYAESFIKPNDKIASFLTPRTNGDEAYKIWDQESIENRQQALAQIALEIWSLPTFINQNAD